MLRSKRYPTYAKRWSKYVPSAQGLSQLPTFAWFHAWDVSPKRNPNKESSRYTTTSHRRSLRYDGLRHMIGIGTILIYNSTNKILLLDFTLAFYTRNKRKEIWHLSTPNVVKVHAWSVPQKRNPNKEPILCITT